MRYLLRFMCVSALAFVPLLGCDTAEGEGGTGGTAGTGGSAGTGGTGGTAGIGGTGGTGGSEGVVYSIRFSEVDADGISSSLEGVEFCEAETDNCDVSDALGSAAVEVAADEEVMFTMVKEGYGSWLTVDVSDETADPSTTRRMFTDAQLEAVAAQLGTDYPWTKGIVGLVKNPSGTEGLTFAPVGSTVGEVGDLFYYDSDAEEYSVDLAAATAVATNWYLPLGAGGFTEVEPGVQEFEFTGTAGNCRASWAWPGSAANTIRLPVRDGYRTYGSMLCALE